MVVGSMLIIFLLQLFSIKSSGKKDTARIVKTAEGMIGIHTTV